MEKNESLKFEYWILSVNNLLLMLICLFGCETARKRTAKCNWIMNHGWIPSMIEPYWFVCSGMILFWLLFSGYFLHFPVNSLVHLFVINLFPGLRNFVNVFCFSWVFCLGFFVLLLFVNNYKIDFKIMPLLANKNGSNASCFFGWEKPMGNQSLFLLCTTCENQWNSARFATSGTMDININHLLLSFHSFQF